MQLFIQRVYAQDCNLNNNGAIYPETICAAGECPKRYTSKEKNNVKLLWFSLYFLAVTSTKKSVNGNGLQKSFEKHERQLQSTDDKLNDCLTLLKKSAAAALRKGRPTTEK